MVTSHQTPSRRARGTGLSAYLTIDYDTLCEQFGEPVIRTDQYKTDAEWHVSINQHFVTIYNYKNGPAYGVDTTIDQIDRWHVGSRDQESISALHGLLTRDERSHEIQRHSHMDDSRVLSF